MLDACATIAATLHTSGIQIGRPRVFDAMLASLRHELAQLDPISPALGAQLNSWLDRIAVAAARSAPLPLCFNHGDFTYGQMLFDGTQSGLVDFDSVCQAEPALDLAQFLTYLRVAVYKALSLARRTLRSWQKFKPSRIESALALLEEEIAGLELAQ